MTTKPLVKDEIQKAYGLTKRYLLLQGYDIQTKLYDSKTVLEADKTFNSLLVEYAKKHNDKRMKLLENEVEYYKNKSRNKVDEVISQKFYIKDLEYENRNLKRRVIGMFVFLAFFFLYVFIKTN